ncbi:MAG: helix-turn-helix transcriptional regulator [Clostridia bacterium]|nr:helix-turn-helix transcriptional regulator [Clostridia bacterium]
MEDLKLIFASNLIRLRTSAGMKQSELGEQLNYSDKSISKWERAEALPDAAVLKRMAAIFGVTVDYLLNDHDQWEAPVSENCVKELTFSTRIVTALALSAVWTLALLVFIILWMATDHAEWRIFVCALPVSLVVWLVLNSVWNEGRNNRYIVAGLVLSLIALLYFAFLDHQRWQLFLMAAPALLIVFLSFKIKKNWRK